MLKDVSKMEQRYDAVTMVMRDGFSITEIAAKFNVSRQTVYRWLAKYEEGGLEALSPTRPTGPITCPTRCRARSRCRSSTCDDAITSGDRFAFSSS